MFNFFKKKKDKKILGIGKETLTGDVYGRLLYANDYINIIHDTCKICYNGKPEDSFDEKREYIRERIASGHESILEHTNIITWFEFPNTLNNDLTSLLTCCKFLNTKVSYKDDEIILIISGSIRGYKHIFRTIRDSQNKIAAAILDALYNLDRCVFEDFIEDRIMISDKFLDIEQIRANMKINKENKIKKVLPCGNNYDIEYLDDYDDVFESLPKPIDKYEMLDLCTVTIRFHDISRIISQQFTRHRVAITQESQRYVDYGDCKFNSPSMFTDKYNEIDKYKINIFGQEVNVTLQELGDKLIKIYPQLRDQKLLKQDARAFLPNNSTTSLYMTFTFRQLLQFLYLRTDPTAQDEIRLIAKDIESNIISIIPDIDVYNIYRNIKPYYEIIGMSLEEMYNELLEEVIE